MWWFLKGNNTISVKTSANKIKTDIENQNQNAVSEYNTEDTEVSDITDQIYHNRLYELQDKNEVLEKKVEQLSIKLTDVSEVHTAYRDYFTKHQDNQYDKIFELQDKNEVLKRKVEQLNNELTEVNVKYKQLDIYVSVFKDEIDKIKKVL